MLKLALHLSKLDFLTDQAVHFVTGLTLFPANLLLQTHVAKVFVRLCHDCKFVLFGTAVAHDLPNAPNNLVLRVALRESFEAELANVEVTFGVTVRCEPHQTSTHSAYVADHCFWSLL